MTSSLKVFINCPFDSTYRPLFQALIFCILYLDFDPIFSETRSGDHIRVKKIMDLIRKAKYGIHDLSRNKSNRSNQFSRFNLPFEMGLDIGSKSFGGRKNQGKKFLILDSKPHSYRKYLSDIGGQDIKHHNDSPKAIIRVTRNWMASIYLTRTFDGSERIWKSFIQFKENLPSELKGKFTKREVDAMQLSEWKKYAQDYITNIPDKNI